MALRRFVFLLLVQAAAFCQEAGLGKITFPTSATPEAQKPFIEGVLWLHNFEYEKARHSFLEAEKADPGFALAYWGEAMTYDHPLWNEQNLTMGRKALEKLAQAPEERVQKAKTEKEKGFIRAINSLYGAGDKSARDSAYATAMRKLYQQFPEDDEIAIFYALALLGLNETGLNFKLNMEAAAIAEEVTQDNPKHPGALHYAIHAYGDPIHAPLGLRAARSYAKIAAEASHALHMPSHIYLALGMWDDVIASNINAWNAGKKNNPQNMPQNYDENDLHALQWLSYGYLQKKDYSESYRLAKIMQGIENASQTPLAKFHYALMRADYIINSQDWKADLPSPDLQEMEPTSRASNLYTNAVIELHLNKNPENIASYLKELEKIGKTQPSLEEQNINLYITPTSVSIQKAKIMSLELRAQIAAKQGNLKKAIQIMEEAVKIDDRLPKYATLPVPAKPAHELLADLLLQNKQYVEAYKQYVIQLNQTPNRMLSNEGLKKAENGIRSQGLSMPQGIRIYFNKLMIEPKTGQ